jgi:RNA polymerase sigma-70 factor (ECF subfamily)
MDDVSKQLEAKNAPDGGSTDAAPTDVQLIGQVMAGKRDAFDVLIRRYQKQAVAVSYRLLGNTQDALEVTQDAFLKAYSALPGLQEPAAFKGWLMRIVSNLSLNKRRGRRKMGQLPDDELFEASGTGEAGRPGAASAWMAKDQDPRHAMESRELGERLAAAIERLPEKQRLALVMFTVQEMPQKEVAEMLQCSVEAVKWHVFQARKKLREMLKDDLIEQ